MNLPAWPSVDFAKFGPVERVAMSRIRKISGPALTRNSILIPHVTNHDDADITELEAFRVQLNKENEKNKDAPKLTMLAFLVKACIAALKKFPEFNASIDADTGDAIFLKSYYHIGFAADTPNGLVVPVIRDADKKGVFEIAQETSALAAKARDGKLAPCRYAGRDLLDLVPRRHRRHLLHADHQRAGSRHPRRVPVADPAGVGRQAVRAAPDPAAVALVGPSRRRRRRGGTLQRLPRADPGGLPPGDAVTEA